jgi:hypothetical protein
MAYYDHEIEHRLARLGAKGLKRKSWDAIYDIQGLDDLVKAHVKNVNGRITPVNTKEVSLYTVEFERDWDLCIDTSNILSKYKQPTQKQIKAVKSAAPGIRLGFDRYSDLVYVVELRGGNFFHPPLNEEGKKYKDNNYWNPIMYNGPSIIFPKPITLEAHITEPDTRVKGEVPFRIAGILGLEGKVAQNAALRNTARLQSGVN